MPAEGGKTAEEQAAKLGKDIVWLRIVVILVVVFLGLVALAVLQMHRTVTALADAQAGRAGGITATHLILVEKAGEAGKETRHTVRAGLGAGGRLELLDASGKVIWSATGTTPEEPPAKESPPAPKKPEEKDK